MSRKVIGDVYGGPGRTRHVYRNAQVVSIRRLFHRTKYVMECTGCGARSGRFRYEKVARGVAKHHVCTNGGVE